VAQYRPNTRGDLDDRVRLVLGGDELLITEGYEVRQGVLTQPSAASLRLAHGGVVRAITEKYPPNTTCQLFIGDAVRFTGLVDGYTVADGSGASEVTFNIRDRLARFHDAYIRADKTYTNSTYLDLVSAVLHDALGEIMVFATENTANRLTQAGLAGIGGAGAQSGVGTKREPIVALTAPEAIGKGIGAILDAAAAAKAPAPSGAASSASSTPHGAMLAKAGERYYDFLKKELDRAGLCLWASADGQSFVLTSPDGNQSPIGRLVRKRGTTGNAVNVLSARYTNDTSKRFSEVLVYARGGGKKVGRTKAKSSYVDQEMIDLGFDKPKVVRDAKSATEKQAEFLARRTIAEANRSAINYVVTVAGHTFPAIGTGERAVWTPDTCIDVQDDELGLYGSWYLEQVTFRRHPQTTTELTLIRVADLVFASDPPL
jgi:prophage tail gpP-like protein